MTTKLQAASTRAQGRGVNITLWVLQLLLAALFIFIGLTKLLGHQPEVVSQFNKIGLGVWFRYLTGAMEVTGGLALLIPALCGVGAIELFCVMMGAILTHLLVLFPRIQALGPLFLGTLLALIAWARWPRTQALLTRFKG